MNQLLDSRAISRLLARLSKENRPGAIQQEIPAELVGVAPQRHELSSTRQQAQVVEHDPRVPRGQKRRAETKSTISASIQVQQQGIGEPGGFLPVLCQLWRPKAHQDNGSPQGFLLLAQLRKMLTARQSAKVPEKYQQRQWLLGVDLRELPRLSLQSVECHIRSHAGYTSHSLRFAVASEVSFGV